MIKTALAVHQQFRKSACSTSHNIYSDSCTNDIQYEQLETNPFANIVIEQSSSSSSDSDTDYEDAIASAASNECAIESGIGNECAVAPDASSVNANPSGMTRNTSIKQSLKDKIKLKRGWQDTHELTNLFESTKEYSLTEEEQNKIELRKQRNRRSANQSRLRRIARERSLEKKVKALEEIQSKLSKEVEEQAKLKQDLHNLWQCHLLQCPQSQSRKSKLPMGTGNGKWELPIPPVTTLTEQMEIKPPISLTQHVATLTEQVKIKPSISLKNHNILTALSKTNFDDDLSFKYVKKIPKLSAENDGHCTDANSKLTIFASLRDTVEPLLPSVVINETSTKIRNFNSTDFIDKVLTSGDSNYAYNISSYLTTHITEKTNMGHTFHGEVYNNLKDINCESEDTSSGLPTILSEVDMTDQKAILPSVISLTTNKNGFCRQPAKDLSCMTRKEHLGSHYILRHLTAELGTDNDEKVTFTDLLPTEADVAHLDDDVQARRKLCSRMRIDNHFQGQHKSLLQTPLGYSRFITSGVDSTSSPSIYSISQIEQNQSTNNNNSFVSLVNAPDLKSTVETVASSTTTASDVENEDLVAGLKNVMNEIFIKQQIDQIKIHLLDDFPTKS